MAAYDLNKTLNIINAYVTIECNTSTPLSNVFSFAPVLINEMKLLITASDIR